MIDNNVSNRKLGKVLVTGGSGFLAGHIIIQLLTLGYEVRTTVRNKERELQLRKIFETLESKNKHSFSCVVADLDRDEGWSEAVADCEWVLHVASPFPAGRPKHENDLIISAREGTLRVLRAARDKGVKRLVMTSSFAAIGYGHPDSKTLFDESCWTNLTIPGISAYVKSKTLAEKAAWDFIEKEGGSLEFCVINPVGIFGPILHEHLCSSVLIIKKMLEGKIPGCPNIYFGVVDVRDVADLHIRAMTNPSAKGERFLAIADKCLSMIEIAHMLKNHLGLAANKVPQHKLPDWIVWITSFWDSGAREILFNLGKVRNSSNEKACRVLGWQPRSSEEAIIATAESLITIH